MNTCSKITYRTYQDASSAVQSVSQRNKQSMRIYKCDDCEQFHLATNGKKKIIPIVKHSITEIKPRNKKAKPSKPRKAKPEIPIYSTEPLISKETAQILKRLINGANEFAKQKNGGS